MVNTNLLKSEIAKKGLIQSDVAKKIGVSHQSFNYKLHNKTEFKVDEVNRVCEVLDIPKDRLGEIFFAKGID